MSTTYGKSPGGYLWAFLEPIGGIVMLTILFSLAFRAPPIGDSFPVFYATGLLPFLTYSNVQSRVAQTIGFSKPLLFYPGVTFIDAIFSRFILNFMTYVLIFYVLTAGLILIFDPQVALQPKQILASHAMAGALGLGVGTLNCFLFKRFPLWSSIWSILNRPLFLVSCLFFTFESVPAVYQDYLWFNPLVHVVGQMRAGFFPVYDALYVSWAYVFSLSGVCFLAGITLLRAWYRELILR